MARWKTVRDARQRRHEMRQTLKIPQQLPVEQIDLLAMQTMMTSESRYYGAVGYSPHMDARKAAVLCLRRHPELRLGADFVAGYLNMTEAQVAEYEESAARTLAS